MKRERLKEVGRFMYTGAIATAIDYTLLNTLAVVIGLPLLVANTISASIGMFVSYRLNKKVVFEDRLHGRKTTFLLYVGIILFGIVVIQNSILHTVNATFAHDITNIIRPIVDVVGLSKVSDATVSINVSKVCGSLVAAMWNYILLRRFVFITKDEAQNN